MKVFSFFPEVDKISQGSTGLLSMGNIKTEVWTIFEAMESIKVKFEENPNIGPFLENVQKRAEGVLWR